MQWNPFAGSDVPEMTADEVRRFMAEHREGTYDLVDVRERAEYETKHIPGARLAPMSELLGRLNDLDRARPIVLY